MTTPISCAESVAEAKTDEQPSRWKCEECYSVMEKWALLVAPSPFDSSDTLFGCPICLSVNSIQRACDITECLQLANSGTPTADGGYTHRCWAHSLSNPAYHPEQPA